MHENNSYFGYYFQGVITFILIQYYYFLLLGKGI